MGSTTGIAWADETWNPFTFNCVKVSEGCANCVDPNTRILFADMSWRPISQAKIGDRIVSVNEEADNGGRKIEIATVKKVWKVTKPSVEISLGNKVLVCSEDHRWLADVRPYWRYAKNLNLGVRLRTLSDPCYQINRDSEEYKAGYIAGTTYGDGTMRFDSSWRSDKLGYPQMYWRIAVLETDIQILERVREYLDHFLVSLEIKPFDSGHSQSALPMIKLESRSKSVLTVIDSLCKPRESIEWKSGWLAGMLDTDGSHQRRGLSISQVDDETLETVVAYAKELGVAFKIERFPHQRSAITARLEGNADERIKFLGLTQPALQRKIEYIDGARYQGGTLEVEGIRRIGNRELVDIETTSGTFVAEGVVCHNCYAETLTERFKGGIFKGAPQWKGDAAWKSFKKIKSGSVVFAPSMTDAFHEGLPFRTIQHFFTMMESRPDVQFLVLTKRIERAWYMRDLLPWPKNVWLGASVEARKYLYRLEYLLDIPAAGHFTSIEPLLESVVLEQHFPAPVAGLERYLVHTDIQSEVLYPLQPRVVRWRDRMLKWVIVGGESGVNRRPFDKQWAREIRDLCIQYGVPFMFKQGSAARSGQDTDLDGREWMQKPEFQLSNSTNARGTADANALTQMSMFT